MKKTIMSYLKATFALTIMLVALATVVVSCRDSIDQTAEINSDRLTEEAKIGYDAVSASLQQKFSRKYELAPLWTEAKKEVLTKDVTLLHIPLGVDPTTGSRLSFIFSSKKDGMIRSQIAEYQPSVNYLLTHSANDESTATFDGTINFYTIDGNFQIAAAYRQGKFHKYLVPFKELGGINLKTNSGDIAWENDLNEVKVVGQRNNEPPIFIYIPVSLYSPTGGVYNGYTYSPGGGGGGSGGGGSGSSSDEGIDCASFDFTQTSPGVWQEAGVNQFRINIIWHTSGTPFAKVIAFTTPIVVGLPVVRANGVSYQDPGKAAMAAAFILQEASDYIIDKYKNFPSMPYDEEVVPDFYKKADELAKLRHGGTVGRTGSRSPNIKFKSATFPLFGNGDCY